MPASGQLMASSAGKALIAAFTKYQPGIRFDLADGDVIAGDVDLSIGRKWSPYFAGEVLDFQLKHERSPREIQIATGSFDVPGWSPALAIIVAKDNPLKGLTIRQLDGIFGGPRRGGWVSTTWRRQAGRGADENIRNWGQLGIQGPCADKPIDVYVPPLKYHIMSVFERKVLVGGNMWNDNAREVPLALRRDGSRTVPSAERAALVASDRCGITFASAGFAGGATRLVPIAKDASSPYVLPTIETVRDRSYPLHLELYAYADQKPDVPMDAKLREFLRFVLSREGQGIIQRDGKWLPMTGPLAAAERAKLDAVIPQVTANK
jgi:ABC-type phosphate transport system substrate-binding protein